jgi:hypothetical protein
MNSVEDSAPRAPFDPRRYQIASLAGLLAYGTAFLGFELGPPQVAVTLGAALAAQWACTRIWRLPRFDPLSALISGLSLCLLLRTHSPAVAALAAVLAVGSKFLIRVRGKHVFNPANFALVAMLLWPAGGWVSPGQWGSAATFAFLMACLGGLVVNRAARGDVTFAFLAFWCAVLFGRSVAIGEPLSIPFHRLESGAPGAVRRAGGVRRRHRAVPSVSHQWSAVGARAVRAGGAPDRSRAAGVALRLAAHFTRTGKSTPWSPS